MIKNILSIYNESAKTAKSGVVELEVLPAVTVEDGWYEKTYQEMSHVFAQQK